MAVTQFEYHNASNDEASEKKALAWLLANVAGKAKTGVLSGLLVAQTTTASSSVTIAPGAGIAQNATLDGASLLDLDTQLTLDVLGPAPMGGLPRNDIIVFDVATLSPVSPAGTGSGGIRAITGTANAVPTDPTIPGTAIPLARLRHLASATTVPAAQIDDYRNFTRPFVGTVPFADYYRGATGTFAGGTPTKLAMANKNEAYGITYSSGDFTVPEAGRYDCTFEVMFPGFASASTPTVGAQIWVNGVYKVFVWEQGTTAGNWSAFVSRKLRLAAGDVVAFYAQHNATSAIATVSDPMATWCQIEWVGP